MIEEIEVRRKLVAFLQDEILLDEFEDWLVRKSWNMHLDSAQAAQDLVSSIELALAEYSSDYLTEDVLKDRLREALSQTSTMKFDLNADAPISTLIPFSTANSLDQLRIVRFAVPA